MTISSVDSSTMSLQDIKDLMQDSGVNSMDLLSELGGDDASMEDMLLQEFDADGDGELSEEEAAALQEKLESMRDFMAQMLEQMIQSATGGEEASEVSSSDATGVSGGEEAGAGGSLSSAIEDALSSDSTDEADANGDGVVTDEELAEFLGVDVADLGSVLNAAAQSSDSEETGSDSDSGFAKDLIAQAIQSYLRNADDTTSEGVMSLGGASDGVNAVA